MTILELFYRFLILGCISFGGPAAHIGYFRQQFVEKRQWMNDDAYSKLLALCQFLPGPASSQVGFGIGYQRAGLFGGIAAFIGFTLPSLLLMLGFAHFSALDAQADWLDKLIHGLKLLAVVVVADAVLGMFKSFCKDWVTIAISVAVMVAMLFAPHYLTQIIAMLIAAGIGAALLKPKENEISAKQQDEPQGEPQANNPVQLAPLLLFGLILLAGWIFSQPSHAAKLFHDFFQAGSLVFGGGHVALPLLAQTLGEQIGEDRILTAYAAAQAVPGPMFTMASFLGADLSANQGVISGISGGIIATLGIFLPGFLLVLAFWNYWQNLLAKPTVTAAVAGVNAAVVGLLLSAFVQPVLLSAIHHWLDAILVIIGFVVLRFLKPPILVLVAAFIAAGFVLPEVI